MRERYGDMRRCYEAGLGRNPKLTGRVTTRFVIERDGKARNVTDHGSDLPDATVIDCVLRVFQTLTFPEPQGGVVTIVYPLMFEPG